MTKFYIVGYDSSVEGVWRGYGCERVRTLPEADIVILTGGADIDASIYSEKPHRSMYLARGDRDKREIDAYYEALGLGKCVFGICRGAQLAHALNGGKLWQDVNHHVSGGHDLLDISTGRKHFVSSCHHQMMRVDNHPTQNEKFEIVATASGICSRRSMWYEDRRISDGYYTDDIEVLWYPRVKTICYQSHPEFGIRTDTMYAYELQKRFGFLGDDHPDVAPAPEPPRNWDHYFNLDLDERLRARMHSY